jgi:integrase
MICGVTTNHSETATADTIRPKNARTVSPEPLWEVHPSVPNLLRYVKSGMYYARLKANGKQIRRSLGTDVFSTARLRLADFIKRVRTKKAPIGTFREARLAYEADLAAAHDIGENTKRYRRYCVKALLESWPELDSTQLSRIDAAGCKRWAARFTAGHDSVYFNNTLGTLRAILKRGGVSDNPAHEVGRMGVKQKTLQLPEPEQFNRLLEIIATAGARQSRDRADFARFLAFSGCRISEARQVTWADVDFERGLISVRNAKLRLSQNSTALRQVPIIADMAALLAKLKARNPEPSHRVCAVGECEKSLTRACRVAGVVRITHHDLRHLFATRCIESGVDLPTVSRWLGHRDGGALAMRVYGHLRTAHSQDMARRVTFANPADASAMVEAGRA